MIGDVDLFFEHDHDDPEFEVEQSPCTVDDTRTCGSHDPYDLHTRCTRHHFGVLRGAHNAGCTTHFSTLGFRVVQTVAVFDEVKNRVVDTGEMSWLVGSRSALLISSPFPFHSFLWSVDGNKLLYNCEIRSLRGTPPRKNTERLATHA
ncbi:hypothetical protein EI94DRAFT_1747322 [Lactarius quietus]|nr:hypothetical protein EI94DRAFT_1747322 [Lactarius quietus]